MPQVTQGGRGALRINASSTTPGPLPDSRAPLSLAHGHRPELTFLPRWPSHRAGDLRTPRPHALASLTGGSQNPEWPPNPPFPAPRTPAGRARAAPQADESDATPRRAARFQVGGRAGGSACVASSVPLRSEGP